MQVGKWKEFLKPPNSNFIFCGNAPFIDAFKNYPLHLQTVPYGPYGVSQMKISILSPYTSRRIIERRKKRRKKKEKKKKKTIIVC